MKSLASLAFQAGMLILPACAVPLGSSELPSTGALATFASALGETGNSDGRAVTPLAVVEDSRCPASVQCIQAGTVRVQVRLEDAGESRVAIVGLKQPAALKNAWLHLVGACPDRLTPERLSGSKYSFTFAITDAADLPDAEVACE